MTIHVKVTNLNNDWRDLRKVRCVLQARHPDGIWRDIVMAPTLLGSQQSTTDTWLHRDQRIIIEETNG